MSPGTVPDQVLCAANYYAPQGTMCHLVVKSSPYHDRARVTHAILAASRHRDVTHKMRKYRPKALGLTMYVNRITERENSTMREFSIPAPPADLSAVKDWQGNVWERDEYDEDLFSHQYPDAYTRTYRTWWELIEEGPLTECRPETFTLEEILKYITPTHNDN